MAQDRKQLEALLLFIEKLSKEPGNEWFVEKLKGMVETSPSTKNVAQNVISAGDNLDSLLRVYHDKIRKKARKYYCDISDSKLRSQLINDHALMLWYKAIDDVELFFVHVNYQLENMLNYYLSKTNFSKVLDSASQYTYNVMISPRSRPFCIDVYTSILKKE